MRKWTSCRVALGLSLVVFTASLEARVVSYAPVTDRVAIPAIQRRTNRRYLLMENEAPAPVRALRGRLVLHDSTGEEDPRVVLPLGSGPVGIAVAAAREEPDGTLRILVLTDARFGSEGPASLWRWAYSPDGGATWRVLTMPGGQLVESPGAGVRDQGGPFFGRGRVQIGEAGRPFVFTSATRDVQSVFAVTTEGETDLLMTAGFTLRLIGSDRDGARPLVAMGTEVFRIESSGAIPRLVSLPATPSDLDGFVTPGGDVYVNFTSAVSRNVALCRDGKLTLLVQAPLTTGGAFAIPTADFDGAWIVRRQSGSPTMLYRHTPGGGLVEAWRDASGPEVEALHAGASGKRLLVQVHRPRPMAEQVSVPRTDPAIAVWEVGQPAPAAYDELYLDESPTKGFVHLDVDSVGSGSPFVFDSGIRSTTSGGGQPSAGGSGGGDVTQEWGVVRGSLRQRLLVPAVARIAGGHGSFWRTDLLLRNPLPTSQSVSLRFVPAGETTAVPVVRTVRLDPGEIRLAPDLLGGLFGVESGSGALFLTPEGDGAIEATTRTYTSSTEGSYGMAVGAVDVFTGASPRFPLTFSGAIQGEGYRSNLVVADTAVRGVTAGLRFMGEEGLPGNEAVTAAPAGGQSQLTGLSSLFGIPTPQRGGLTFQTVSGSAVAGVIAIDDRTNDPTYFPPDLPASTVRTIPAIVHQDGANGARFRSDLFLANPTDQVLTVVLQAKAWDRNSERRSSVTLLPRGSLTLPDVLLATFGMEGVARLSHQPLGPGGVRVTSRTYTVTPSGGTYGLLVPPLNSFQSAAVGESLEILGPIGGRGFRTNLSLVELAPQAGGPPVLVAVEVVNEKGVLVDTFEVSLPRAGGLQIDDLFRARGLGDGPAAALLRIRPSGGNVAAYATLLDNGTNDPTYFGAALAAKE